MGFSEENDIKILLKEQPFYHVPTEEPKIKHLNKLPFFDELNSVKTAKAFKRCARSYSIETIKDEK